MSEREVLQWQQEKFRKSPHGLSIQLRLLIWRIVYALFFYTSPKICYAWRRLILRVFGAQIGPKVRVYPNVKIWAPWNLTMLENSCLGDGVDCYSVGKIQIGKNTTVSQRAVLCGATHDHSQLHFPLLVQEVHLGDFVWVAAEAFIMPGVKVGTGSVVGVRSLVTKDVPEWKIVLGSPAKVTADRPVAESQGQP